jgi:hypothetical protein
MMPRLVTLPVAVAGLLINCAVAQADPGNAGAGPSPGLCDYPAVCGSGDDGALLAGYYYWEDFPTELNGSHRHCEWGGAQASGSLAVGFSMMFTVAAGTSGPVGGVNGSCFYVCPDMQRAEMPNPPGGWKDAIIPRKCQPIGGNPFLPPPPPVDVPIAPPIGTSPSGPVEHPFVEDVPPAEDFPSVTNPVCPNPDATVDRLCK